jgi:SAM-dependent methyltransferase
LNCSDNNILAKEYKLRFNHMVEYRKKVWEILARFFQSFISETATILDLGAGYGEFINNIKAEKKYAMDLNPEATSFFNSNIIFINQDCATKWQLAKDSLDVVFSSNFLEHLPSKIQIQETITQAYTSLKSDGILILLGPNIKYVGGEYWDFWDHHIPLTESSITELLKIYNFKIIKCIPKFLPYSMSNSKPIPLFFISLYLRLPFLWKFIGKQFLIVAKKVT